MNQTKQRFTEFLEAFSCCQGKQEELFKTIEENRALMIQGDSWEHLDRTLSKLCRQALEAEKAKKVLDEALQRLKSDPVFSKGIEKDAVKPKSHEDREPVRGGSR